MATITNKKQYPSEQYLNELITNMEFAARAPVEVVRAMAAELQKRRKADSAEPVAWRYRTTDINGNPNPRWSFSEEPSLLGLYQPLYADPQQPLSFPDAMSQPVSNRDELPYAQVKAAADLYALCWQSGEVVTYTPDPEKATIWLNNYSGTCVQEYVKLERLQEALSGNSPVVPDDWVMVPKEPTRQMMAQGHFAMKGTDRGKFRRIYQAMITAASALNKGSINAE